MPHDVPSHVALPFPGTAQGLHDEPHELVDAFVAQDEPQTWYPAAHDTVALTLVFAVAPVAGSLMVTWTIGLPAIE
jgi:hypothetical protein